MKRPIRGFAVYAMILIAVLLIVQVFTAFSAPAVTTISYNELMELVKQDAISAIAIDNTQLVGLKKDTAIARESFPMRYDFECIVDRENFFTSVRVLTAQKMGKSAAEIADSDFGFEIEYLQPETTPWYVEFLPYIIMTGLLIVFWMFIMRQQAGGGNKMMNFGKSRAKLYDTSKKRITFADVAGAEEEKEEMAEIVEFLKNPRRFTEIGARIPKGVLLVGPPGTGKTLLAKAVAGEANVPFFSISGSDFVEMFVGVGASRVRDLFDQAKKHTPSIVFIDEIDAVGRHRGAGLGGGHDEREQTLNQLLVEMDGFAINEGVIVLAATNRRDILDPALLRPGRFDRQITVNYPDVGGREAVLRVHTRNKPLADDVDLKTIARRTPFFTGADLENVMNEAAILAARAGRKKIDQRTIEEAITRVEMGPEKKSRKVGKIDQRICAYHEAGHALVGAKLEKCDEVHMVTIVPRGSSGGHTQLLPNEENEFVSKQQLIDRITMALGGRAAETLVIKDVTTGAVGDLQMATETARRMVTQFGMNENIGPVYLSTSQEVFLGRDIGQSRNCSEQVAAQVDEEIRKTMESCQKHAEEILEENMDVLHLMAETLIERETITGEDLAILLRGEKLPEKKQEEEKAEEQTEEQTEEKAEETGAEASAQTAAQIPEDNKAEDKTE